jgi:polyhydroxyalkanoate synthesis regulator phasin
LCTISKFSQDGLFIVRSLCYAKKRNRLGNSFSSTSFYIEQGGIFMNISGDLKKIVLAGIGAAAVTAEKSKEIVDDLVSRGELTVSQGKVLNEELKQKAAEKNKEKGSSSEESEKEILNKVEKMTPEQRAELKAKLEQLDSMK